MSASTANTDVLDVLREAVAGTGADRVFGAPVTGNGTVMLPVAKVSGGAGGGGGNGPAGEGQPEGTGGGFGTTARGLGVFVLRDGKVTWHPAIDVNRVVLGGQLVAIMALLVARELLRGRRPARDKTVGRAAAAPRNRAGGRACRR
ncbi:sporulation protein [Actinoplanes sp. LDG1-06]|uniref:Sporulation protein n=1 Tax=Paractinoplanes ovalisporus TaxID=2810368 RepID=A0ABS2A973_9ACTN|nr:spore germination protein GerW family protein [Actinoplanes ovalisporus]MBM2616378.1 sporulation protein [Actinoplanes ovalisporus]